MKLSGRMSELEKVISGNKNNQIFSTFCFDVLFLFQTVFVRLFFLQGKFKGGVCFPQNCRLICSAFLMT